NGFRSAHPTRLPLEFRILRQRPEPWTIADSLVCGKLICWMLSANWDTEWLRGKLVERLGPEAARALEAAYPADHPLTAAPGPSARREANGHNDALLAAFQNGLQDLLSIAGGASNAWAVAPTRAASGGAMLASDPHLQPQMPSIWYEAHLSGGDFDVAGATMPGIPPVLIGQNRRIAWGITASIVDNQDLFVEEVDPQTRRYRTPEGSLPLSTRIEEISVRGKSEPIVERIEETRHGPELSPLLAGEPRFLAIQSPILRAGTTARGMLALNRAANWEEFRAALADFDLVINVVYADAAGNIGYQLSGKVPRRKKGTGLLPAPGWDAAYDWDGYLSGDELPHVFNPPEGYVVSANNRLVGDDYPHHLSHDWCDGFRARRIADVLTARERLTVEDFAALHQDFYSEAARQIVAAFRELPPRAGEPLVTRAREYLRRWDYQLRPDSVAASIYAVLRAQLLRRLFEQKLGPLFGGYTGCAPTAWPAGSLYPARIGGFLITLLEQEDPAALEGTGYASWDDLKWESLRAAVADLRERLGDDLETWTWGRLHILRFDHPLGRVKPLGRIFSRGPVPVGGDADTPHQSSSSAGGYAANGWIPTYRQIVDFGNRANSCSIHTLGQSGQPGSPHFDDFLPLWRAGRYHPTLFDRAAVRDNLKHLIVLRPASGPAT
ncbi:MAG TPA: penicillin acylase family protein, partial [Chloroflexota bacterium]|nr:penicillin acylase family protein [Chloroflexota bacterium]